MLGLLEAKRGPEAGLEAMRPVQLHPEARQGEARAVRPSSSSKEARPAPSLGGPDRRGGVKVRPRFFFELLGATLLLALIYGVLYAAAYVIEVLL